MIALAVVIFNQLSGINAIPYYINDIFALSNQRTLSSSTQAIAVGFANLVFTLLGMALIDRVGRKIFLTMAIQFIAVLWNFPETKGRSLEDIQSQFVAHVG